MKNTAIIIPTRLGAKRFPNKPLAKINNVPMIIHVLNRAKDSKVGDVFVATPDKEIIRTVEQHGGKAVLTKKEHLSGSDRVHEVYIKLLKNNNVDLIINLQDDMTNIESNTISKLEKLMRDNSCDIGTLASPIKHKDEIFDPNVVKVHMSKALKNNDFLNAKDFFRKRNNITDEKIYHHIGIYAFTNIALSKYVRLPRSKLEIERNLEQMRALDNNLLIKVGLSDSLPLGVDTEKDLKKVIQDMK
jgi:3-deoxy-manno-octulosonate cytidylyltransferase (CMP-KDO synthetase)